MTIARRRTFRIRVGAVLLALGTVQFFAAHLIAQRAWPSPYSWTTNYISDLGAVTCAPGSSDAVCSPLHAVMNTAFLLQGALLIGGTVLTAEAWTASTGRRVWQGLVAGASASTQMHRSSRRAATVLGIVGVVGFALLAVATTWPDGPVGVGAAERTVVSRSRSGPSSPVSPF